MIRRAVARALLVCAPLVLAVALVGCTTGTPAPTPSPVPSVSAVAVPAGGISLTGLGFQNGPAAAVTLPAEVRLGLSVDQPNMVTMTFLAPDGAAIGEWLRTHLAEGGFRITASSEDGVVFEGYGWSGAFTMSETSSALTLRRVS